MPEKTGLDLLVGRALKYSENERKDALHSLSLPKIAVIGVGGSGNNTINRLKNLGINRVTTIAVNTDRRHLELVKADTKVLIGENLTRGLGAYGDPNIGRKAAELARGTFEELLSGAHVVFICAGLGGGTGTGATPVIAEIAKKQGATVIGIVQIPFRVERARIGKAIKGLNELRKKADTVIVLDNNKLLEYVPKLPIDQAFSVMDQLIAEAIKNISDIITQPSLINIDFMDVKAIMEHGGLAVILFGESKSQNRVEDVVKSCMNHPLFDIGYRNATGALIQISAGPDLTIQEAEEIVENLTSKIIDKGGRVIWGAKVYPELEGTVRVVAIMTGLQWESLDGLTEKLKVSSKIRLSQEFT